MDTFTADLEQITAGDSAGHYMDDENFNYAVSQMEEMGHDRTRTANALREWIARTPMWDCPECGHVGLDEAVYPECPICETPNPNVKGE